MAFQNNIIFKEIVKENIFTKLLVVKCWLLVTIKLFY
jgi:hypothetical protein